MAYTVRTRAQARAHPRHCPHCGRKTGNVLDQAMADDGVIRADRYRCASDSSHVWWQLTQPEVIPSRRTS